MALTRSEWLTYIKRTFKRTDKDTELIDALNDTLYDLTTSYDFQVYQTETEFTVLDDTSNYTYPASYAVLISYVRYIDSGGGGRILNLLSKDRFDRKYPNLDENNFGRGDSYDCCIYNDKIYLGPYVQTANGQKFYVSGSTVSEELANDSSTSNFQDRWREVIKFGTLYRAYNDLDEDALSAKYLTLYKARIDNMIRNDDRKDNSINFVKRDLIGEESYYGS